MSEALTAEELDQIEKGCKGVTPGPWIVSGVSAATGNVSVAAKNLRIILAEITNAASFADMVFGAMKRGGGGFEQQDCKTQFANADHIARLDPQTVLALLAGYRRSIEPILWCVHVRGPDDMVPVASYEAAVALTDALRKQEMAFNAGEPENRHVWLHPLPALWLLGAQSHAEWYAKRAEPDADYPLALDRAAIAIGEPAPVPPAQPVLTPEQAAASLIHDREGRN